MTVERRRGSPRTLREMAIASGMTVEEFDALTPKQKRKLHTTLTAGTGTGKAFMSNAHDGEPTRGKHGVHKSHARRRAR